jgi:hypothetical protein
LPVCFSFVLSFAQAKERTDIYSDGFAQNGEDGVLKDISFLS